MNEIAWSEDEQQVAQTAFAKARDRELNALMQTVRQQATKIDTLDDLWHLHDFLSARRHDMDGKYDYRYPVLIFVFSQLLKEGWLTPEDLMGLTSEKRTKITALARM